MQPMTSWMAIARGQNSNTSFNRLPTNSTSTCRRSYLQNELDKGKAKASTVKEAYRKRLEMELLNVAAEAQLRQNGDTKQIKTLERLIKCEAGLWPSAGDSTDATTSNEGVI